MMEEGDEENSHCTQAEDDRHADLTLSVHLQLPHGPHGQQDYEEIHDCVDHGGHDVRVR